MLFPLGILGRGNGGLYARPAPSPLLPHPRSLLIFFHHSLIYSLVQKYFLSIYYVLDTVLYNENIAVLERNHHP